MKLKRHYGRYLIPTLMLALAVVAVAAPDALAVDTGLDKAAGSLIPKTKDLGSIIGNLLKAALGFVGTLFLLLMIYAGFLWMTARGDAKKVDQAKQLIVGAVIGIVVIASAYAITSFVLSSVAGTTKETPAETTDSSPPAPSCNRDCMEPINCGGMDNSCGICSSCKCADGSLSTNGFPCPSTGSCVCY